VHRFRRGVTCQLTFRADSISRLPIVLLLNVPYYCVEREEEECSAPYRLLVARLVYALPYLFKFCCSAFLSLCKNLRRLYLVHKHPCTTVCIQGHVRTGVPVIAPDRRILTTRPLRFYDFTISSYLSDTCRAKIDIVIETLERGVKNTSLIGGAPPSSSRYLALPMRHGKRRFCHFLAVSETFAKRAWETKSTSPN
jgi:hypothetical protein